MAGEQHNRKLKLYCEKFTEIENYEKYEADPKNWVCHHRMEIQPDGTTLTVKWMKEHNIYYNVEPEMLIFMTRSEHMKLHAANRDCGYMRGRKLSIETRKKMSEAHISNPRIGFKHSEETKKKMSETLKGHKLSEETKQLLRERAKRQWENQRKNKNNGGI